MTLDDYKGVIAIDFDGVLCTYEGWKGVDIFGDPIPEPIEALRQLKKEGYYIIIFTTRLDTPKLREWLKQNNVVYDDINKSRIDPPHTSNKPVYHCIIDDRAFNFNLKNAHWDKDFIVSGVKRIINKAKEKKNE